MSSVWVKVYIGKNDSKPRVLKIEQIPEDIYSLKKAIKKEEQLEFPASQLVVYPAQHKDDCSLPWKKDNIESLEADDSVADKIKGKSRLIVLAPEPEPKQEGVVGPSHRNQIPDHFVPILLQMAVRSMAMGWERISSERTSVESVNVRDASISYYGLMGTKHCQILGPHVGSVQNAHIWPYNNRASLMLVDLEESDIDNPRNVLRLHTDIEHKFDRFAITFVQSGGDFILKVLDPALKASTKPLQGTHASFQSIDGMKLLFPSNNRPWKRLLGTHSILAHRHARKQGWLADEQLTEAESSAAELMEWSLDEKAQARIKLMLNRAG